MSHLLSQQIAWWFGIEATIPNGWALCDGNNGTPNLLDSILAGAGNGPGFVPDDSGGAVSHDHDFVSGVHLHQIPAGTDLGGGLGVSLNLTSDTASGTTDAATSLPPYHALLPIMLL